MSSPTAPNHRMVTPDSLHPHSRSQQASPPPTASGLLAMSHTGGASVDDGPSTGPLAHQSEFVSMMSVSSEADGELSDRGTHHRHSFTSGGNSNAALPALVPAAISQPSTATPVQHTTISGSTRGLSLSGGGGGGGGHVTGKPYGLRSSTSNTHMRRHGDTGKMTNFNLNTSIASPMMTSTMSSPLDSLAGPILSSSSVSHLPPTAEIPTVKTLAAAIDRHSTGRPVGSLFSLFGSLERRVKLSEMVALYHQHRETVRSFLSEVLRLGDFFSPPFDLIAALEDPSMRPQEAFFETPLIAWPLVTLYLVASFVVTARQRRYDLLYKALVTGGFFSIGKGCFAALAVASSENEAELIMNTHRYCRAALCVGMAYQQKLHQLAPIVAGSTTRGFSMLLINIPLTTLQLIIDQVNTLENTSRAAMFDASSSSGAASTENSNEAFWSSTPFSEVHISRIISARSAVVVGHPVDLLRLDVLLVRFATKRAMRIHKDILPSDVPENSPFYNQGLQHEVLHHWRSMGISFQGSELKVPFYSPTHGGELNSSRHLMAEIASAVTCVPQDLTYSLQNLRDGDLLLDFSASSMRIGQMIAWTHRSITCLALPSDRIESSILPSPRRSAQPEVILGTLNKCAVLNELLTNTYQQREAAARAAGHGDGQGNDLSGSPNAHGLPPSPSAYGPGPRVVQLATSFIDAQLLIDLDAIVPPGPSPYHPLAASDNAVLRGMRSPDVSITSFPLPPPSGPVSNGNVRHNSGYFMNMLSSSPDHTAGGGTGAATNAPTQPTTATPHAHMLSPKARSISAGTSGSLATFSGLIGGGAASAAVMGTIGCDPVGGQSSTTAWIDSKDQLIPTHRLAVVPSAVNRNVINVYQVSPLIKYLELQHRCVLTPAAVDVAEKLRLTTNFDFPPYTLLMCPTVFALLEFWDGLEFMAELRAERNRQPQRSPRYAGASPTSTPFSSPSDTANGPTASFSTNQQTASTHSMTTAANLSLSGGVGPTTSNAPQRVTDSTITRRVWQHHQALQYLQTGRMATRAGSMGGVSPQGGSRTRHDRTTE